MIMSAMQMEQLLEQLTRADRTDLEMHLDAASFAIWQVRRALGEPIAGQMCVARWRAYGRMAIDALTAADEIVAPYMAGTEPGP
jgi:hypothetical protein